MLTLYPHQDDLVARVRAALAKHRRVILQAPTGAGKTAMAATIVLRAIAKGSTTIFCVHRKELLNQTMDTFDKVGIRYGLINAGYSMGSNQVQIASIDTLARRLDKVEQPSLLIIDECHHAAAAGWSRVIEKFHASKIVGLTATPHRLDGKGLRAQFDHMELGPKTEWLIENKFLSPFRAYAPSEPDLKDVKTTMGDYAIDGLANAMDRPMIVGDAVTHYQKLCDGQRAIAFCTTIRHSQHVAESFNDAGIKAWHIDGTISASERAAAITAFRDGECKVLSNCGLISEGLDIPAAQAVILLRPTQSLSLYLQQVGRCLRFVDGKTAVILDHAGNIKKHGLPISPQEWTLDGRQKKKKNIDEIQIKQCPECFACFEPAPECPICGHIFASDANPRGGVKHVDGTLEEINLNNWRATASYRSVVASAETLEDFNAIAKARGYKRGWAKIMMTEREEKLNPPPREVATIGETPDF